MSTPAQANFMTSFLSMPIANQIGLLAGLAVSVALSASIIIWAMEPNYEPLFHQLSARDTQEVIESLKANEFNYKLDSSGMVLVSADEVQKAKLKLAAEGLPRSNDGVGVLGEGSSFRTSQFMENARYKHSLEGELARTIMQFNNVKKARVHLAIPKQTAFVRKRSAARASVFLDVYRSYEVSNEQVSSIVNLIASSIPHMDSSKITIVDQTGRMYTQNGDHKQFQIANQQLKYKSEVEGNYEKTILELLEPIVGMNGVRAQVSADVDFTHSELTTERFNPNNAALRSEYSMVESSSSNSSVGGVPGSLSNRPPSAATTTNLAEAKVEKGNESSGDNHRQFTKNYELDKTIQHVKNQPAILKRLTVAVVVDHMTNPTDPKQKQALSAEELKQVEELVKLSIGFNEQRGDKVTVTSKAFIAPQDLEPLPEPSFYEQNWFMTMTKQIGAGMFIFGVIFFVLKPVMKMLLSRPGAAVVNEKGELTYVGGGAEGGAPGMDQGLSDDLAKAQELQSHEERVNMLQTMASHSPQKVAQIVKNWVDE